MNRVDVEITGMDNVIDMLNALPKELASKRGGPVRKALRKAAVIIQKEAQKNIQAIIDAPNKDGKPSRSTGALKNAVTVARGKYLGGQNGERFLVWVPKKPKKYASTKANVRSGKAGGTYLAESPQFYGRFLEYGTSKMQAKKWLRPAFETKRDQATATANQSLIAEIEKISQKLLKGK
jgi:HK97 gp10 family phage protein